MIAAIGGFVFNTKLGQALLVVLGGAAMFLAWLKSHDARVAERATAGFSARVEKATEKARAKAVNARKPARQPGAAERLRKLHCRDC